MTMAQFSVKVKVTDKSGKSRTVVQSISAGSANEAKGRAQMVVQGDSPGAKTEVLDVTASEGADLKAWAVGRKR